jgi:hypothetical protein
MSSPARCQLLRQYMDTLLKELVALDQDEHDDNEMEEGLKWQAKHGLLQVGLEDCDLKRACTCWRNLRLTLLLAGALAAGQAAAAKD